MSCSPHVPQAFVFSNFETMEHVLPCFHKFFNRFSVVDTSVKHICKRLISKQPPQHRTRVAKHMKLATSMASIWEHLLYSFAIAWSWSVIMFFGCSLSIATIHCSKTHLNVSIVSSGNKAHPSEMVWRWLLIPTI